MSGAPYFTTTLTVKKGDTTPVAITGQYLSCIASNLASFQVSIDGASPVHFEQGLKVREPVGSTFTQIIVDNTAGADDLTVTLAYGMGDVVDARMSDNTPKGTTLKTTADVAVGAAAAAEVLPFNSARRRAIVSNPIANAREVRVGDVNTAVGQGIELAPGDSLPLDTAAAIYVFNPHSAAQSISLLELED